MWVKALFLHTALDILYIPGGEVFLFTMIVNHILEGAEYFKEGERQMGKVTSGRWGDGVETSMAPFTRRILYNIFLLKSKT